MPAGAKINQLIGIADVGLALEVLFFQASEVDEHLSRRRFAGKRREPFLIIIIISSVALTAISVTGRLDFYTTGHSRTFHIQAPYSAVQKFYREVMDPLRVL